MTNQVERLRVELGDRAYEILVGPRLLERAGREIQSLLRRRRWPTHGLAGRAAG